MQVKQIIGLIGSFLLIAGAFCPIIRIPTVGQVNYFNHGHGDGVIILTLGIISLILALFRRYQALILTGILSLGMVTFTFYNIYHKLKEITSQLSRELANSPLKGVAETMVNSIQIEWGVAVIGIGVLLLIIAPLIKEKPGKTSAPTSENNSSN